MAPNLITRGRVVRRGLALLATLLLTGAALSACGGGGGTGSAPRDPEADAELLDHVLSRQMAAVGAYGAVLGRLSGRDRALAAKLRAQEQEHVDATVKALRGLGAKVEPEAEEIELVALASRADRLRFLYEVESATIDSELSAISRLTAPWPRSLLGSVVANQAQHLVLLRRALGARPLAAVPDAFENGTTPAP